MRRYRYGFEPTTQFEFVQVTEENQANYCPHYSDAYWVIGYMKGKNGHYLLIDRKYGDYEVVRLYTRNQWRESNYVGRFSIETSHRRRPASPELVEKFKTMVINHAPYHHVPKVVDRQKNTCYAWEASFGNDLLINQGKTLGWATTERAVKYVQVICEREGVTSPQVKFSRRGSCSWARGDKLIKFLVEGEGVSNKTIIHEVAHVIDHARNRRNNPSEAGHGPSFIGIYIDLLVKYGQLDRAYLERMAASHKLKWTYKHCLTQPQIAKAA